MKKLCMLFLLLVFFGCSYTSINQESSDVRADRFEGKVEIGMTKQQVENTWGKPDRIIKKQKKDFDEIWIYIPNWKFKNYLYFQKDILIGGDPDPEDLI